MGEQLESLKKRRTPKAEPDAKLMHCQKAAKKQRDMWEWQLKMYKHGKGPLDEWKEQRNLQ